MRTAADSLSPFLLRPDKALAFAAGGVLAYRVIGGTAVISADPVAPDGRHAATCCPRSRTRRGDAGWQIVLWGAAETHLEAYRALGLHAMCVGEEAFVDPRGVHAGGPRGAQAAPVGAPRGSGAGG